MPLLHRAGGLRARFSLIEIAREHAGGRSLHVVVKPSGGNAVRVSL